MIKQLSTRTQEAWAQLEDLLHLRCEEVASLIDVLEIYAPDERGIRDRLSSALRAARSAASPREHARADLQLRDVLGEIDRLQEHYPELASCGRYVPLRTRIQALGVAVNAKRMQYNRAVTRYNTRLEQIPYRVASLGDAHRPQPLFRDGRGPERA